MSTITFNKWSNLTYRDYYLPLTDNDEAGVKSAAYSTLALLWGKQPLLDNVDYGSGCIPYDVEDTDENRAFYQARQQAFFDGVAHLIDPDDIEPFLRQTLASVKTNQLAWYVACRWTDAEDVYGPHPSGLTVTDEYVDGSWQFRVERRQDRIVGVEAGA